MLIPTLEQSFRNWRRGMIVWITRTQIIMMQPLLTFLIQKRRYRLRKKSKKKNFLLWTCSFSWMKNIRWLWTRKTCISSWVRTRLETHLTYLNSLSLNWHWQITTSKALSISGISKRLYSSLTSTVTPPTSFWRLHTKKGFTSGVAWDVVTVVAMEKVMFEENSLAVSYSH